MPVGKRTVEHHDLDIFLHVLPGALARSIEPIEAIGGSGNLTIIEGERAVGTQYGIRPVIRRIRESEIARIGVGVFNVTFAIVIGNGTYEGDTVAEHVRAKTALVRATPYSPDAVAIDGGERRAAH